MGKRIFRLALGVLLLAFSFPARAQQPEKILRIGYLGNSSPALERDFVDAFSFMTSVALTAERLSHHPEWRNVYNVVTIRLTTHDAGGVSENDLVMAAEMSRIHQRLAG